MRNITTNKNGTTMNFNIKSIKNLDITNNEVHKKTYNRKRKLVDGIVKDVDQQPVTVTRMAGGVPPLFRNINMPTDYDGRDYKGIPIKVRDEEMPKMHVPVPVPNRNTEVEKHDGIDVGSLDQRMRNTNAPIPYLHSGSAFSIGNSQVGSYRANENVIPINQGFNTPYVGEQKNQMYDYYDYLSESNNDSYKDNISVMTEDDEEPLDNIVNKSRTQPIKDAISRYEELVEIEKNDKKNKSEIKYLIDKELNETEEEKSVENIIRKPKGTRKKELNKMGITLLRSVYKKLNPELDENEINKYKLINKKEIINLIENQEEAMQLTYEPQLIKEPKYKRTAKAKEIKENIIINPIQVKAQDYGSTESHLKRTPYPLPYEGSVIKSIQNKPEAYFEDDLPTQRLQSTEFISNKSLPEKRISIFKIDKNSSQSMSGKIDVSKKSVISNKSNEPESMYIIPKKRKSKKRPEPIII